MQAAIADKQTRHPGTQSLRSQPRTELKEVEQYHQVGGQHEGRPWTNARRWRSAEGRQEAVGCQPGEKRGSKVPAGVAVRCQLRADGRSQQKEGGVVGSSRVLADPVGRGRGGVDPGAQNYR